MASYHADDNAGALGCLGPVLATSNGSATHPITTALPLTADVVSGIRVERRIEIDQANAIGRDTIAEILEIVAVVERNPEVPVRSRGCAALRHPASSKSTADHRPALDQPGHWICYEEPRPLGDPTISIRILPRLP